MSRISPEKILSHIATDPAAAFSRKFRSWLVAQFFPTGVRCPKCGEPVTERQGKALLEMRRVVCGSCGGWFGILKGSQFAGVHVSDLAEILWVGLLLGLSVKDRSIASLIGRHVDTVESWRRRFSAPAAPLPPIKGSRTREKSQLTGAGPFGGVR